MMNSAAITIAMSPVRENVTTLPTPMSTAAIAKYLRLRDDGSNRAKWTANGSAIARTALSSM